MPTRRTTDTARQITELGDKSDHALTPKKLAAFYKAVGGDYDGMRAPDSPRC